MSQKYNYYLPIVSYRDQDYSKKKDLCSDKLKDSKIDFVWCGYCNKFDCLLFTNKFDRCTIQELLKDHIDTTLIVPDKCDDNICKRVTKRFLKYLFYLID